MAWLHMMLQELLAQSLTVVFLLISLKLQTPIRGKMGAFTKVSFSLFLALIGLC